MNTAVETRIMSQTSSPQSSSSPQTRRTTSAGPRSGTVQSASFLTGLRVFSARSLKHSFRDGESLLMAIMLPLMLMLIFTFVLGGAMDVGEVAAGAEARDVYLSYVLPAIAVTVASFGASYTAVVVSDDMTTGFMNRLRTMPFPAVTVLLGHTVSSMVRNLMATAVVVIAAIAMGFRSQASALQLLGAVGMIALWILVLTCVFTMLGMLAGSAEAASGYGFMVLFLPYVSSGFAPVETMPDWLRGFAEHQPMTPIIDTSRALMNGAEVGSEWWIGLLWSLGLVVVSVWLTALIFPRKVAR